MSFEDILKIAAAILASLGGAGAIVFGLSSFLGKVWANRLMEADRAEHARKLEELRAQLTHQNQSALEAERARYTRELEDLRANYNRDLEKLKGEQELRKEYEILRNETALKYLQRQIEELYSPLLDLIQYSDIVFNIEKKRIPEGVRSRDSAEIKRYFVETYYLPLNSKMAELIRNKIYLLDSDEIPDSFKQFLKHHATYEGLHNLWKDKGITSEELAGGEWPMNFESDVKNTLNKLRRDYNEYLRRIQTAT